MLTNRCYIHRLSKEDRLLQILLWLGILSWVIRATLFMRRRDDASQFTQIDIYAFVHIAITGFLFLLILIASCRKSPYRNLVGTSGSILLIYYIFCATSAIWSPLPVYSFYRAVEVITQLLAVFIALSYSRDFLSAEQTALRVCVLTLILSTIMNYNLGGLLMSLRSSGLSVRWGSNGSSASAALILCYCFGEYGGSMKKRRRSLLVYGLLGFIGLFVNKGSASTIAATCGIATIAIISRSQQRSLSILILASLAFTFFLQSSIIRDIFFYGKSHEQIMDFHGRTQLWELYTAKISQSPIYGEGFVTSERLSDIYTTNTHNSIFSVLLSTGVIGLAIVLLWIIWLIKEIALPVRAQWPGAVGCAAMFVVCFINSMTVTIVAGAWRPASLVFVCLLTLHLLYLAPSVAKKGNIAIELARAMPS